jgi:zinc/manganese transport system substrate-binding protein
MLRIPAFLLMLIALLGLAAPARAELRIVASTADLAAVAKQIGGKHVKVTALALHTQDPHFVDARPHLALELAKADLLLVLGLGMESGWLPTLITGSRNRDILPGASGHLNCSQFITPLDVLPGKPDRSQGDIHPGGSPHYMADPRRAAKVAQGIAKRMAQLDPDNAKSYEQNVKDFVTKLEKWRKHWEQRLASLKGKKLVAYHKSFTYLADWLGFELAIHVEPKPGVPPNPGHVARVIAVAREGQVRVILQESFYPDSTSKLIAKKSGAKLVAIAGAPNYRGGQSYVGYVNDVVGRIERALGK